MIEQVFRSARVRHRLQQSLLGPIFNDVMAHLVGRGYAISAVHQYVQSIEHFDRWLRRTHRLATEIDEAVIARFLQGHLPRCRCPAPAGKTSHQVRAALRQLLVVLRARGVTPERRLKSSPALKLIEEFRAHLRDVRGAASATCAYYGRYAQEFVATQVADRIAELPRLPSSAITRFFTERSERWTTSSMKVATTALRSFFRFLLVTGRGDVRLVRAVPMIPLWKLASIPRLLTDEQVRAVLASFDRSTSTGLRDHAMVTCLAALGLRACEVVALRIEDFDWRAGTITVPATKTRREDVLPLPRSVACAVLAYLRRGRPTGRTRHVFVRHVAPVGTAAGPSIVRRAVREACARARIDPRLAGPHVFRHTVATRLLRTGATVKEVADLLRHRSIDTVSIYAKVDLPTLRSVVLPWPGGRP
jgi:site-specific recombinase XerD